VRLYHRATKHHPRRYARGPHGLDWDTQPDPFRRYAGTEVLELAHPPVEPSPAFDAIVQEGGAPPAPVDRDSVSRLFRHALGLSAWKVYETARWSLRMNPSSGNLHPTEGYLVSGPIAGLSVEGLVAHYAPAAHALELRARLDAASWARLAAGLPRGAFLVGLTSILWRESWKYGERAYRYCQHDAGHAIAALAYSASCLGWRLRLLDASSSAELRSLLGAASEGEAEVEEPDVLLAVLPGDGSESAPGLAPEAFEGLESLAWNGTPNELSPERVEWEAAEACWLATEKPRGAAPAWTPPAPRDATAALERPLSAHTILRQRRSAVAMDGRSSMPAEAFYALLERCMPRAGRVPFASLPWRPRVQLGLYVHRVEGLERGLYALLREEEGGAAWRAALDPGFAWTRPPACPESLPLFLLAARDSRGLASAVSCEQAIAGDGAFSLGMFADLGWIEELGSWAYPRLYWEAGCVGQTLYLEAEAAGLRGTGIGCYFDDAVHQSFGLRGERFQSLYHFTIGGAVEDTRLQTEPPYPTEPTSPEGTG